MFSMIYEFNLLHHVGVVDKRVCAGAAAAHEGDDNTPSGPTGRGAKIAINQPFRFVLQPLLNMSENCSLVTCITNLGRIHVKLFMLSRPQGQIIDIKCEKLQ